MGNVAGVNTMFDDQIATGPIGKQLYHAPGFNWYTVGNDIAALELQRPYNTIPKGKNKTVAPVDICASQTPTQDTFLLGFGKTEANGSWQDVYHLQVPMQFTCFQELRARGSRCRS